jgi:transposase-like protein
LVGELRCVRKAMDARRFPEEFKIDAVKQGMER